LSRDIFTFLGSINTFLKLLKLIPLFWALIPNIFNNSSRSFICLTKCRMSANVADHLKHSDW
uniref:Ovule protein n=1 Tax=Brugia timori TaxID=42155 RepID=A0A0R3Q5R5_9BILA